jgi:hypothetical protein
LITHHADSRIQATLPGDGAYYLHLKDAQGKWGNAYAYRLQVAPPRPDFQLRVVPSSLGVRAGTSTPVTVHVLREEGFTNDIELSLKDAPRGFSLGNTRLSGETNQFQVKVKVAQTAPKSCNLVMVGRALVAGAEIIHSAVPAEDVMQAFIYRHLVPAQEMKVAVIGPAHPTQPVSKSEARKSP